MVQTLLRYGAAIALNLCGDTPDTKEAGTPADRHA
jgi:hypothetical protein